MLHVVQVLQFIVNGIFEHSRLWELFDLMVVIISNYFDIKSHMFITNTMNLQFYITLQFHC